MNSLLQLKGEFIPLKKPGGGSSANIPTKKTIASSHLRKLLDDLKYLKNEWRQEEKYFEGILVQVKYNCIIAKSNRLSSIFSVSSSKPANDNIVGAKYSLDENRTHIITYFITETLLDKAIEEYKVCIEIFENSYNSSLSHNQIADINKNKLFAEKITKKRFVQLLVDSYYIEKFFLEREEEKFTNDAIITIYDTNTDTRELLKKMGIEVFSRGIIDKTTLFLKREDIETLIDKAPYLIAMAVTDFADIEKDDFKYTKSDIPYIPSPTNEPIIGVIDTLFDENVYFSEWVDFTNMVDEEFGITEKDYEHGTSVSSIIVDGANTNPHLDDGCGRFKVRHFGVAKASGFSSFGVIRDINDIVRANPDIKVWNLSLGSKREVHKNFISPEASFLDQLQHEKDVIFVISGTNKTSDDEDGKRIGSPADSINALVVNSVDIDNNYASYSRKGPVLSFFTKPDIACFGGDGKDRISVCTPHGEALVSGTSFAAPWIARKLAYLIHIQGLSREVAKALIIHSALGWSEQNQETDYIGHGIVPKHIEDIIKSQEDEIRFVVSGTSEEQIAYNYNLPVPQDKNKYPFIAKATMCYFPACSRSQGVDYTNTEFEFSFGRIDSNDRIKGIQKKQEFTSEGKLRTSDRKWDNVKNLIETDTGKRKAKDVYGNKNWGIRVASLERLEYKHGRGLNFGLVITLKEINGKNRIDKFIQLCQLRGWLVNKIDVQTRIDIHNIAEQDIEFEDI